MNRQVVRSPVARFLVAAGKLAPPQFLVGPTRLWDYVVGR
jgi:hypothetical protein